MNRKNHPLEEQFHRQLEELLDTSTKIAEALDAQDQGAQPEGQRPDFGAYADDVREAHWTLNNLFEQLDSLLVPTAASRQRALAELRRMGVNV